MKLRIRNGFIYRDDDQIVGTLILDDPEIERAIELGTEALPAIEEFIIKVNSGKFTPRTTTRQFEALIEKHKI